MWELTKAVSNLDAPAIYRFRVTFRWLGAHDKVLATAVTQSGSCAQRELRPDLLVRSVAVAAIPHKPHKQRYAAVIADRGASGAGPFQVLFTPGDGSAPQTQTVSRIDAHSSRRLSFVGPLCDAGSPPTVVADSSESGRRLRPQQQRDDRHLSGLSATGDAGGPSREPLESL